MKGLKDIILPSFALLIICTVVVSALVGTNWITSKSIEKINEKNQSTAMAKIIPADSYKSEIIVYNDTQYTYYTAQGSNGNMGCIFNLNGNGYGGLISVMTGIGIDGKVIAIEILDASNETPGLGQNVSNDKFRQQFSGKGGEIGVVKSGANDQDIAAITGATITSQSVTDIVNLSLKLFEQIGKSGDVGAK